MSNAPGQLTPFQQKTQLRLQEMEVEWRRTLFERFRHICREEMMEVMKTLLETMHTPQALEQKLEELRHSSEMAQDGMQTILAQTCEEVRTLSGKLESQTAASVTVDTTALETAAKEAAERQEQLAKQTMSQQEKTSRLIQDDVRKSTEVTRKSAMKAAILSAAVTALICAGAVAGLKYWKGITLVTPSEMVAQRQQVQEVAQTASTLKQMIARKMDVEGEIENLTVRRSAAEADLKKSTESLQATMASLAATNQLIAASQRIQDQFRFKLVKGEDGGVFVEIPADAKPFEYQGQTFIQVK
ncbi:hypothetical protein OpiT1DRAFT_04469 [Opitutaceae bacterium TAV1]|nr:hypothetical protein OpiT1DRAFT_04469 [Opitutaceae bacterium TAV1]